MGDLLKWHTGLWCILSIMLLAAMGHTIAMSGHEAGDFAANSILVQYAKHFDLLKGNYSRAMFNHPGPAILYIIAGGETLFHDLLGITSPVGGQFVAIALSEAAWLTVSTWLFARLGADRLSAIVFLAFYALFVEQLDHSVLGGLWFPHIYVAPFGAFVLACAALIRGESAAAWPLATAWGYLAEGHASFFAICAVTFAGAVAAYFAFLPLGWTRPAGIRAMAKAGAVLIGVLALFAVPFMIRVFTEPESPLSAYLAFGRQTEPHTVNSAISYLTQYWGSTELYRAGAVLAAGWLALEARRSTVAASVLAAAGAATAGSLLYAVRGVDNYALGYIELFYGAVPALAVGTALAVATAQVRRRVPVQIVLTTTAACLIVVAVTRQNEAAANFNVPYVPEVSAEIDRVAGGPAVLDLQLGAAWPDLQGITLAVEAYRLRNHEPRLCIGGGWHVSFSTELLCSSDEVAREPHVLLDVATAPPPADQVRIGETHGIALYGTSDAGKSGLAAWHNADHQ